VLRQRNLAGSYDPAHGAPEAAFVALALDHAYQAFETLLVRLEEALGLPRRTGANWHGHLLDDAQLDLAGMRPALLSAEATRSWRELLKFRHFLRHAYSADLDPAAVAENRRHLENAVDATLAPMAALLLALEQG
jgi:hypothetical protein